MLAFLLCVALAAAPSAADYEMRVRGARVGRVHLELEELEGGLRRFGYLSETLLQRGPVVTRTRSDVRARLGADLTIQQLTAERTEGGVLVRRIEIDSAGAARATGALGEVIPLASGVVAGVPSALAPGRLGSAPGTCVRAVDELAGEAGEVCGAKVGDWIEGTLLGQRFRARLAGAFPERLELPDAEATFRRVDAPPELARPGDLFGAAVATLGRIPDAASSASLTLTAGERLELPASANQQATPTARGAAIRWTRAEPPGDEPVGKRQSVGEELDAAASRACRATRWETAGAIAAEVSARIPLKAALPEGRSALQVLRSRRGDCTAHVELFLALARSCGLPARRAVGLVAFEGKFWAHAWAQVEVGGAWYDVDPTEGEAPAVAARILFADGSGEARAGRLFARSRSLAVEVAPR